ncbi:MAG TPA: NapH/MauN family ferredoxin-type protein, partial [Gammaproteobacteria bacterium]|nr:NapH/MauN family ferredoxin-type protein [Gammaproteobacteria bacterium]
MNYFIESISQMLGRAPAKPLQDELKVEVREIYEEKRKHKLTKEELLALEEAHARTRHRHKWRNRRWATLIIVNLLFVVSYYFDVQLVEGALTASRVVGFHMADLNSALQVMLAYKH